MTKTMTVAIQQGYPGITFDNVTLFYNFFNRCGIWKNGTWVQQFTGGNNDAVYIDAVLNWARWMYNRLHALGIVVTMNPSYDQHHPELTNKLTPFLDLLSSEKGFGIGTFKPFSYDEWFSTIKIFQGLDAQGKGFVSINQMPVPFEQVTKQQKQWVLANYLLVKGNHSYVSITGEQEYGTIFTTPEYSAPIGRALNEMYVLQGVYMRDFSNGKTIVNPSHDKSLIIKLLGVYRDLYGNSVSSVTLKPLSGMVLLGKKSSVSPVLNLLLE